MAEEIKRVEYYSVTVATKLGEGARILAALSDGGVDFTAVWGYPLKAKTAQVDLLPADAGVFKKAAKKAGLTLTKRAALLIQGDDKPGAVSAALGKLAAAGLKLHAAQAMSSRSRRMGWAFNSSILPCCAAAAKTASRSTSYASRLFSKRPVGWAMQQT